VIADFQGLERSDSRLGYRADIGVCLAPDNDLGFHASVFLFVTGQQ